MKLYFDTNILRDCLKRRNLDTVRLMEILREKGVECFTSMFGMMELVDTEKDNCFFEKHIRRGEEVQKIFRKRGQMDLNVDELDEIRAQVSQLFISYNFVKILTLVDIGWNNAYTIGSSSNLDSNDSLHLAMALGSGCNCLVTSDAFLKKEGMKFIELQNDKLSDEDEKIKFEILTPSEVLKKMVSVAEEKVLPVSEEKIVSTSEASI